MQTVKNGFMVGIFPTSKFTISQKIAVEVPIIFGAKTEIGEARIIINMHNNGFTAQQIADATDKKLEDVQAIIEGKELMTV